MRSCLISQSAFLQPCLHPSLLMLFTRLVISTYARPLSLKLSDLRSQSATYFNDSDSMTPESKCDAVSGRWNQYCTFFALPGDYESPNCTKAVKNKPNGFDLSPWTRGTSNRWWMIALDSGFLLLPAYCNCICRRPHLCLTLNTRPSKSSQKRSVAMTRCWYQLVGLVLLFSTSSAQAWSWIWDYMG